jgi:tRNA isopentenyl-2-thiomethyl-A-37 hydroxylase MiaE
MAKTSLDWWNEVLTKPGKMEDWLRRQYQGEAGTIPRLYALMDRAAEEKRGPEWQSLIAIIIRDEEKHAEQVAGLMRTRKLVPALIPGYKARYFQQFPEANSIQDLAAMGAYAELISLTRFKAILLHPETPADIRWQFTTILFEEEFHYAALRRLAGEAAMTRMETAHHKGLQAVGIE